MQRSTPGFCERRLIRIRVIAAARYARAMNGTGESDTVTFGIELRPVTGGAPRLP
jgi:hypothetical protein